MILPLVFTLVFKIEITVFLFGLSPEISGFVLQAGLEQSRSHVSLFACVAIVLTERTRNNRETLAHILS